MPREIWHKAWSTSGRHGWFLTNIRVERGRVHETWERDEYTLERGGKSFDYPKRSAEEEFQEPCDIDKSDEETKKGCNKNDEEPREATETEDKCDIDQSDDEAPKSLSELCDSFKDADMLADMLVPRRPATDSKSSGDQKATETMDKATRGPPTKEPTWWTAAKNRRL